MKLLIISSLYTPTAFGGSERVAQTVAESMLKNGHAPIVITTCPGLGVRKSTVNNVKVYYVGLRNVYWPHTGHRNRSLFKPLWHLINSYNPWMATAIGKIMEIERPDVVNTHSLTGFSSAVWPIIKRFRVPLFHTLHDYALMCPQGVMFRNNTNCVTQCYVCRWYSALNKQLSQHVDGVIGVSHSVLQLHLRSGYFVNSGIQTVIYNAHAGPVARNTLPSQSVPYARFGFVGKLTAGKGIEWLLSSFQQIAHTGARLLVAGDGDPQYVEYLKQTYGNQQVEFLGFTDPEIVYRQTDVLIAPSLWREALGNIVFEAYLHGLPTIVSDRGGLPEMVDDGCTGYVCCPDEPNTLTEALLRFVRDPSLASRMRPAVLEKSKFFHLSRFQDEYQRVLTSIA